MFYTLFVSRLATAPGLESAMEHLRLPAAGILNIAVEVVALLESALSITSRSHLLASDRQLSGFLGQGADCRLRHLMGLVECQFHIQIGPDAVGAGAFATVDSLVDCVFSQLS